MEYFKTSGWCGLCNTPLEFEVGKYVDSNRWELLTPFICKHCNALLSFVVRDACGRFWGRRVLFSD
jgi:hypothetical protein